MPTHRQHMRKDQETQLTIVNREEGKRESFCSGSERRERIRRADMLMETVQSRVPPGVTTSVFQFHHL